MNEAVILKSYFLDTLPRHTNIMVDEGFNIFDECAARCVHFMLRKKIAPLLPEGIVKYSHLEA